MATDANALMPLLHHDIIQHGGMISFADFMSLALYHPQYGYYCRDQFELGERGDFTTASEHSPLFAKCFARQCQQIVNHLGEVNILELGAGTGRFAGDLLLELEKQHVLPRHYYIYEVSHTLRKKQHHLIQSQYPTMLNRIIWLDALPKNLKGIVIANEVLDALPVHCFRIAADAIQEKCVTWEEDQLAWKYSALLLPALAIEAERLKEVYALSSGYESEINLDLSSFMQALADTLQEGVIFICDYGYSQREYYHPERNRGTLTCFYQHHYHENPLVLPGLQDITAHVDFSRVLECAFDLGCALSGFNTQAMFLLDCDLLKIAAEQEQHLSAKETFALHQAIKLLTLPTEMGERVKVMALNKNMNIPLRGFRTQDLRRML